MSRVTKLLVAVTGHLVAVGTLVGTISMTVGKGPEPSGGLTIVLNSPEAYEDFITNHPAG